MLVLERTNITNCFVSKWSTCCHGAFVVIKFSVRAWTCSFLNNVASSFCCLIFFVLCQLNVVFRMANKLLVFAQQDILSQRSMCVHIVVFVVLRCVFVVPMLFWLMFVNIVKVMQ